MAEPNLGGRPPRKVRLKRKPGDPPPFRKGDPIPYDAIQVAYINDPDEVGLKTILSRCGRLHQYRDIAFRASKEGWYLTRKALAAHVAEMAIRDAVLNKREAATELNKMLYDGMTQHLGDLLEDLDRRGKRMTPNEHLASIEALNKAHAAAFKSMGLEAHTEDRKGKDEPKKLQISFASKALQSVMKEKPLPLPPAITKRQGPKDG